MEKYFLLMCICFRNFWNLFLVLIRDGGFEYICVFEFLLEIKVEIVIRDDFVSRKVRVYKIVVSFR